MDIYRVSHMLITWQHLLVALCVCLWALSGPPPSDGRTGGLQLQDLLETSVMLQFNNREVH